MQEIWLALISDIDDGQLFVNGVFDNKQSAIECVEDDCLAAKTLVYKVDLEKIQSSYIPFDYDSV